MGLANEIGFRAEEIASRYLESNGFRLMHRNWRSGRYELDVVASKGDTLHIIEVKCRKAGSFSTPEQAVTAAKFRSLQKAAAAYISENGIDLEVQFDILCVEYDRDHTEIRYIPDALSPRW